MHTGTQHFKHVPGQNLGIKLNNLPSKVLSLIHVLDTVEALALIPS